MSSGRSTVDVSLAAVSAFHNDDEDPLGLLPGALRTSHGDVHDRVDERRSSASLYFSMGPETTTNLGAAGDCYDGSGDPREAIDAMLRSSKAVRDQVSWRQAQALSTYKAANHQLHKDLSLLPPTYSQFKAVRQRASSSRIRRSSPPTSAGLPGAPASVSHPLNFHLHGGAGSDNGMGGPNNEGEGPPTGLPAGGATGLEKASRVSEGEQVGAGGNGRRAAAGGGEGLGEGNRGDKSSLDGGLVGEGGGVSGGEEVADEQAGGKRFSTLARAGSASENTMARTLWPFRLKPSGEGDIPALRRGKVRGREMVFALLEAARVEEEDMEEMFSASRPRTPMSEDDEEGEEGRRRREMAFMRLDEARRRNARELDALMVEYDARPSRCRRGHALNKLRKALPWPAAAATATTITSSSAVDRGCRGRAGGDSGTVVGDDKHGRGRSGTGDKAGCGITDSDDGGYADNVSGGDERNKLVKEEEREGRENGGGGEGGRGGRGRAEGGGVGGAEGAEGAGGRGGGCGRGRSGQPSPGCGADDNDRGQGGGGGGSCGGDVGGDCREVAGGGGRSGDGGHLEESAAQRDADDARGRVTGGEFLPFPSSDNAAPPVCHDGVPDGLRPGDPPQTARVPPTCGGNSGGGGAIAAAEGGSSSAVANPLSEKNEHDAPGFEDHQQPDEAAEARRGRRESPRKAPHTGQRKKPTLPDPNELNGSVMADPFNMDHMKDLPGLSGGDDIGLSKLVSAHVTFMDPAFPNLEFHRRAGMDRAGYFMPGYKPQVNSPGPAAGAYWLERRQSYRVKMAAPLATQDYVEKNANINNRIGSRSSRRSGDRSRQHQRPRRRSPPKQG